MIMVRAQALPSGLGACRRSIFSHSTSRHSYGSNAVPASYPLYLSACAEHEQLLRETFKPSCTADQGSDPSSLNRFGGREDPVLQDHHSPQSG